MEKSKQDLDTEFSGRPLVFVPDTAIQRIPTIKGRRYKPPVKLSTSYFDRMSQHMNRFSTVARFEFQQIPLYSMFDNKLYKGQRHFWNYVLRKKFPIYIVSSLMGIIWPGEFGGTYDMPMEHVFYVWRQNKLWEVTLEIYEKNNCDRVIAFLPPVYNNVVYAEGIPWFRFDPEEFVKNIKTLKYLARDAPFTRDLEDPNIIDRMREKEL